MAAGVDDERLRALQGLDLVEQQEALFAARDQPRRRRIEQMERAVDLGRERRDTRVARGFFGARKRGTRRLRPEAAHRDPRHDKLMRRAQGRREGRRVEPGEAELGFVETSDEEQAPDLEIARLRGVNSVAMVFEHRLRGFQPRRRPVEVARGERDLGLGHDAAGAGQRLFRPEGARRIAHERLGAIEVAQLRHGYAA